MNQFLPSRYVEVIQRLALGIEPIDAQSARRLSYGLQVVYDVPPFGLPRPPIERHASNLYALRYQPGVTTPLDLRFFDSPDRFYKRESARRRIVPRRLSIPILTLSDVETQEQAGKKDFKRRIRRPVFFPGAAYDFIATATGLRGRVLLKGGQPVRWARVVATLENTAIIAGRAHGDDRGEFLLLINPKLKPVSGLPNPLLPNPLKIKVSVFVPATAPTPISANLPALDPLWDLPLEEILASPGTDDPVETGDEIPKGYSANVEPVIEFTLGKYIYEEFEII
ncbi:MAG: hypothetical protein AABN34_02250 [Acidobacteriota bacterium]